MFVFFQNGFLDFGDAGGGTTTDGDPFDGGRFSRRLRGTRDEPVVGTGKKREYQFHRLLYFCLALSLC